MQTRVQPGTSYPRVLLVKKTVKYCVHCKKNYHPIDECHIKYPKLASKCKEGGKPSKRRCGNPATKVEPDVSTTSQYYAENDLVMFTAGIKQISMHFSSLLPTHWIWDCGASQHGTLDRELFSIFRDLHNQLAIQGVTGQLILMGVGNNELVCSTDSSFYLLSLSNVLYITGAATNLIS